MAERYEWEPSNDAIAATYGLDPADVVRFDQNTAPDPPADAGPVAAMAALGVNEYPDASYLGLRQAAAAFVGVDPDQVVAGAGLDELILLAAQAFLATGDRSVMVSPTYSLHRLAVRRVGATAVQVPLIAPGFDYDADSLLDAASESALTWLCVPNNPTGNRPDGDLMRAVIEATPGITVLDAAYAEVAGDDWSGWLRDHPRLVVMHTLSKGFGLAGARVGYALASPDLVAEFDDLRPPGSISSVSVALGIAALSDPDSMRERVAALNEERARLFGLLLALDLAPVPSEANFLLCPVPAAARVAEGLRSEGIVVRSYGPGILSDHLRFTVRSPEQDDRLIDALRRHL
jgi:histidinol-phosphate aminotransferase